jgi:hypothetical protein
MIGPAESRLPRNRPSITARRQQTLLLLKSPLPVTCTSPVVRMERLKLVVIFVIAQVDVSAARRANRRSRCAAYLLFSMAIEAFDDPGAFALP